MRPGLMLLVALVAACLFQDSASAGEQGFWGGDEPAGSIVVATSERRLYFILGDGLAYRYRIAVGRPGMTWFGKTSVIRKREHPSWRPTEAMRSRDPRLPVYMAPGPNNPLGTRAIYLAQGALRIHGTNAPRSIGRAASSGCFRMLNEEVEDLYEMVDVGAPVFVRR